MSTQPRIVRPDTAAMILGSAVVLFCVSACSTAPQGTTAAVGSGSTSQMVAKEIEPAPVSTSYPAKKDVFQGAEYVSAAGLDGLYANARHVRLRPGEIVEVFQGSWVPGDGQVELAFYLPPEAASVAQVIVESKGFTKTYFLRGLDVGETVGGVVERRWLDVSGYRSKDVAHEARVQEAVRANPVIILVE